MGLISDIININNIKQENELLKASLHSQWLQYNNTINHLQAKLDELGYEDIANARNELYDLYEQIKTFKTYLEFIQKEADTKQKLMISEYGHVCEYYYNKLNYEQQQPYDLDSLDGINSIPIPAADYPYDGYSNNSMYYVLQRKATQHKRAGNMKLAIACLRKSNDLSDYYKYPPLMEKDYMRLIKYLRKDGQIEAAEYEEFRLRKKHPEFYDKRALNKKRIAETLRNYLDWNVPAVKVYVGSSTGDCPICSKYNGKYYSINANEQRFPPLPIEFIIDGGFCEKCYVELTFYSDVLEHLHSKPL